MDVEEVVVAEAALPAHEDEVEEAVPAVVASFPLTKCSAALSSDTSKSLAQRARLSARWRNLKAKPQLLKVLQHTARIVASHPTWMLPERVTCQQQLTKLLKRRRRKRKSSKTARLHPLTLASLTKNRQRR